MNFFNGRAGYIPIDDYSQILDDTEDVKNVSSSFSDERVVTIYGFKRTICRIVCFHSLCIFFLGVPYLLLNWFPSLSFYKYRKCNLRECDIILVTDNQGQLSFTEIVKVRSEIDSSDEYAVEDNQNTLRLFHYQHTSFLWSDVLQQFVILRNPDDSKTVDEVVQDAQGIVESRRQMLVDLYGPNIIKIHVKSYWKLFTTEILNPFYLFQFFSIFLWSFDDYYLYAGCVLFLSAISIISSLYETRAQSITLRDMVEAAKHDTIQVKSFEDHIIDISSDDLVPGDIIVLQPNEFIMPCDAILLTGSCIVNESMLTGESIPIMKSPPNPANEKLSFELHKRHILFAGTHVVQTRCYGSEKVHAKVLRTGFSTSKGLLIKSILFPKSIGFQFYKDTIKFITGLFCIAIFGMIYCVRIYMSREAEVSTLIVRTLDVITIVVPPALPIAMTAGTIYSQSRLKKLGIFCISPPRINVCGKIKLVCFDKTGTLTDDNLTLHGVIEYRKTHFEPFEKDPSSLNPFTEIIQAMATCHSLSMINDSLTGDPLDIEMFKSINWNLIEPGQEHTKFDNLAPIIVRPKLAYDDNDPNISSEAEVTPYLIGIPKCYQFSSEKQCMTVITQVLGHKNMKVFTKGAPEKIKCLCVAESIPDDYLEVLTEYTSHGYRVLALAYRELSTKIKWREVATIKREDVEKRLTFIGFMILENCIKPETKPVIEDLQAANIRTVMITGDNLMTAISVARDCRMVLPDEDILVIKSHLSNSGTAKISLTLDRNNRQSRLQDATIMNIQPWRFQSAMDGETWAALNKNYPEIIQQILIRGTIFARFAPEQKSHLVGMFQQMDYIVAMCGDGANDCSALRAAHIGISLSQAEASVAAPFTSKMANIKCVTILALEGRCALVTSFGIFKYMTLYSLIQFCTILILYTKCSLLGNVQFLYIDLAITSSLAFTMGNQGPSKTLVAQRPMSSLISLANIIPLLLQITTCAAIQIGALMFLLHQNWFDPSLFLELQSCGNNHYLPRTAVLTESIKSWENTVVFLVSCFQYLLLGAIYCKGKPYRQPVYRNYVFVIILTILIGFTTFLLVRPLEFIANLFDVEPYVETDEEINQFRLMLLVFPFVHLCIALFIENFIAERRWLKQVIHFVVRKSKPKNRYKLIESEIDCNRNWLEVIQNGNDSRQIIQ